MPGIKRSPGPADVDVCEGAYGTGSSALQKAYRQKQWTFDGAPVLRTNSLGHNRYQDYPDLPPRSIPAAFPESPSNDSNSSDALVHAGFENLTPPPQAKNPSFEESGLPPTPPTLDNSDDSQETRQDERISPPTIFADGVRNALHSKQSGQSTPPVNAVSPPTPDPSPPATTVNLPAMEQKEKPQFLHPIIAESASAHFLRQYPSSRADSFKTAREDQPQSPKSSAASPVHLPDDDRLPQHWLDSTRELRLATLGLGNMTVAETPKERAISPEPLRTTPKSPRRRSKHESPPQTAREDSDWEKHISYVSGPDELDEYIPLEENAKPQEPAKASTGEPARGLGLTGAGLQQQEVERSAEDVNNMVYKRIQEENVRRHSVISATPGAITVGIILPADSTPKTLKRQTKCLSLREGTTSGDSKRSSVDSTDRKLTGHKKIRAAADRSKKLEASTVLESSIRQVSSPARLGPDASNMTALTYASMQNSPSMKKIGTSRFQPESEHKLRHLSYGDRLSNNMSVRRTSTHGSPLAPSKGFEIYREPEYPPRRISAAERAGGDRVMMNNVGIKRSSTEGAKPSRVLEKPRGVIPSVASTEPDDMLERSPTSGRLRRFSRDERLENNEAVRRTSLDHGKVAKLEAESAGRGFEIDRGVQLSPLDNGGLAQDKGMLQSSPRKSLDARFLHPTTTPMSASQFSDRTENVELCEASGVRLYPHNNESLLVVQHGSRPVSKDKTSNPDGYDLPEEQLQSLGKPIFAAQVDPPTPVLGARDLSNNADSPLTNPRAAPAPPVIQFIPPTPNTELERELGDEQRGTLFAEANIPNRRLSLLQRARRYSDTFFKGRSSMRQQRREPEERETYLSPLWRPQGFWDDFDSEDEEDFEPLGALPKGGDTSDVGEDEARRRGIFPRAMSKRLPGFRGQGGFLVGNSLGLDRHGTNNRRHYISTGTRTLSKRTSEELLKRISSGDAAPQASQDSLRRIVKARTFVVPFSGGKRAQWVGTKKFRARVRSMRLAREEKAAEKRRQVIKGQIGPPGMSGDEPTVGVGR